MMKFLEYIFDKIVYLICNILLMLFVNIALSPFFELSRLVIPVFLGFLLVTIPVTLMFFLFSLFISIFYKK